MTKNKTEKFRQEIEKLRDDALKLVDLVSDAHHAYLGGLAFMQLCDGYNVELVRHAEAVLDVIEGLIRVLPPCNESDSAHNILQFIQEANEREGIKPVITDATYPSLSYYEELWTRACEARDFAEYFRREEKERFRHGELMARCESYPIFNRKEFKDGLQKEFERVLARFNPELPIKKGSLDWEIVEAIWQLQRENTSTTYSRIENRIRDNRGDEKDPAIRNRMTPLRDLGVIEKEDKNYRIVDTYRPACDDAFEKKLDVDADSVSNSLKNAPKDVEKF